MIKTFLALALTLSALMASGEQLYINGRKGNDANPGTQAEPLRTLNEAARRINANPQLGATTVIVAEGVYPLTETVLLSNDKYSQNNRLVIRAEVMPDDPGWNPQRMPLIVNTAPMIPGNDGEESRGIDVEASHVTIEGLRFTGGPGYYYIDGRHNRRAYAIWRDGNKLEDLLVSQCLFAGDTDLEPMRVAVIANGHGLVLDHCVFYHCQNPVVFWDAEGGSSRGNAMRHCLVYGCSYSGMWTTKSTADDFEFHHNIIAGCSTGWIREGDTHHYRAQNCIFTDNKYPAGYGNDVTGTKSPSPFVFLSMENVQTSGTIEIEKDQAKNNYLQLKEGSFGSGLKAGLFRK
ncbi:MAG: hypothetical protein JO301_05795 [Chitinophagaceae bacterium]|nr:hypothetical protein [Chitinophagaceae bacterium]